MWENATPIPPPQSSVPSYRKRTAKREGEFLLWGQCAVCLLVIAVAWGAVTWQWPFLPVLRTAFETAMRPDQTLFLSEERSLSKFTEQTLETISNAADDVLQRWSGPSTAETARRLAHGKEDPVPSNAREESYLPDFSVTFPLQGTSAAKTSGYGWRADPMGGSGSDFHLGNDLAAATGTPVLAATDGVVRYAGTHSSYGNYLRILHANGDETLYAHLQYLFVHSGQSVSAGQCIGTVGETGNTTGPHLHFEILHKGIRYDPSEALQQAS